MAAWSVLAGPDQAHLIGAYLRSLDETADIEVTGDPWTFRERLAREGGRAAIVGEGYGGPAPINVAAAVVADGWVSDVTLIVAEASGSVRSCAKRAGVTRVLSASELAFRSQSAPAEPKGAPPCDGAGREASFGGACEDEASGFQPPGWEPERKEGVPVMCFVSGRGGVGKSSVCALTAHIAAAWGLRVAVLDLDLAFGNLFSLCGINRPGDIVALAEEGGFTAETLARARKDACERVSVWGPCAAPEYAELVQPMAERLIAGLTQSHDLVLIDTSTNWGDAVASAAQAADRLVIVSDERPGAVASLARCGALAQRLGVARTRTVRLMNGCDPRGRDSAFVARAAAGVEGAREIRVADGGDEAVELLASGHAAELAGIDNAFTVSLAKGLRELMRELGALPSDAAEAHGQGLKKRRGRFFKKGREVA